MDFQLLFSKIPIKPRREDSDFNYLEFIGLLTITALLAGFFYLYREYYLNLSPEGNVIFRAARMFSIYVIIPLIYAHYRKIDVKDWGIKLPDTITGFLLGMGVYGVALLVFWKYRIFFDDWQYATIHELVAIIPFICIMAAITDFWTRGFVLLTLEKRYGWAIAIITQNVFWFILHFYEVLLIAPYITLLGGIVLTLVLGVMGDLVALHYRNIWGLMIGHALLNIIVPGLASGWFGYA